MPRIIPTIGASGEYELSGTLAGLITTGEKHTCKSIRTLSDYLANNEDPKNTIYIDQGLLEAEYDQDILVDMEIVSLQSEVGHWLHIPVSYLLKYPDVNGVIYRSVMIGLSLPSFPVERDLSFLLTDLTNLVTDELGVVPVGKLVETSRPVQVEKSLHDALTADRLVASSGRYTDRSRYQQLLTEKQTLLDKITELELYIETNYVP